MSAMVMGVDSSTQSCKVEFRDAEDGTLISCGRAPHPRATPPSSEQNANSWWDALVKACKMAIGELPIDRKPTDVAAVAVDAQCHGLVILNKEQEVIRQVKLWNDTTSAGYCDWLQQTIGKQRWIDEVGSLPTAAFTLSKIAYVANEEPALWAQAHTILLPHDYLTYRLCGRFATDRSEASGTGYFNSERNEYVPDLITLAVQGHGPTGDELTLPDVLAPNDRAGGLTDDAAWALGLPSGIPVGPGCGDSHSTALGLGVGTGELVLSLGTSGVVFTPSEHPVYDQDGYVNGVADATGGWLPLVCVLNCAKALDTARSWLGVNFNELNGLAMAASSRADRPVFVPYLDGERTPNLPNATGTIAGLTSTDTRESLALAFVEGIALGLDDGRRALTRAGVSSDGPIRLAGGGSNSIAVASTIADLAGREVLDTGITEAACRGASIQAAAVLSGADIREVRDAWKPQAEVVASPRTGRHLDELRERYAAASGWRGLDRVESATAGASVPR
ncbi:MAG: xylulokinase [Bifidobacterium psychraerophilum]|uniref:xylulokinase n=1 Tax=Bifidobacterium psychraerophilum TaxID=218140 RepID=UPI0039E9D714